MALLEVDSWCMSRLGFFALFFLITVSPLPAQIDRITGKPFATRSEIVARHGMVCTSVPFATQVGLDVLKRGGSAVDAAIAANATLGLMVPVSNGIGGDLFAIVYSAKENKLYGLNGSGRSPLGLSYEQMKVELAKLHRSTIPPRGMLPISVPGAVDAWGEMHRKFGKLKFSDDLAPAVKYAEEGFPVTELIAYYWHFAPDAYKDLPGGFFETYTLDGKGRTPLKGDIFKNPALAKILHLIGEKGRDVFYEGEIADKIDKFMQENGGFLRKTDIAKHPLAGLLSKEYAAGRRKLIDPSHAAKKVEAGVPNGSQASGLTRAIDLRSLVQSKQAGSLFAGTGKDANLPDGDTIYMCTADDEGNMVSLIQSNYRGMGSGVVVPGLGFMFQDRGELFSMEPAHANVYAPGKRPFHTIIPGFVMKDGKPWEAFGVMGGGMQPQGHVQVLTNQIDFDLNAQEAGNDSRWQHEEDNEPTGEKMEKGGYVEVESGIPYEIVRELEKRGHEVRFDVGGYGGYQAIKVELHDGQRIYVGASESRKDGQAAGY